jgi:hypothetical protein
MSTATELRLQQRNDALEVVRSKHEDLLAARGDGELSETDKGQIKIYREQQAELQEEITGLLADVENYRTAEEHSRMIRRAGLEAAGGDPEGPIYRTFPEYARDRILTGEIQAKGFSEKIKTMVGSDDIERAHARLELLKRTPANTLSSNVAGLTPAQHINQIYQVIDKSRPMVASASRADLNRGQLTYPKVTTRPVVAVQNTEKTEAGNTGMVIDMVTATASVYLGGGDLSWQAVNWSTPNALNLWFDLAAADYALKTEQDAGTVLQHSGWTYKISSAYTSGSGTFANLMTAIGAGAAAVYANSGRTADTVYFDPAAYWYAFGMTSNAPAQFAQVAGDRVGPLRFVMTRGLDAGEVIVGDSSALLCAETPERPGRPAGGRAGDRRVRGRDHRRLRGRRG